MTAKAGIVFTWIEFDPRPLKDGLHDSGYRYIRLTGVTPEKRRVELGQWHDALHLSLPTTMDVTREGTIRIMCERGHFVYDGRDLWVSSAFIDPDGRIR
jgi:hypothetical protein